MSADKIASPILAAVGLGLIVMFLQVFNPEQKSAGPTASPPGS